MRLVVAVLLLLLLLVGVHAHAGVHHRHSPHRAAPASASTATTAATAATAPFVLSNRLVALAFDTGAGLAFRNVTSVATGYTHTALPLAAAAQCTPHSDGCR